jgi:hypothetical protein
MQMTGAGAARDDSARTLSAAGSVVETTEA